MHLCIRRSYAMRRSLFVILQALFLVLLAGIVVAAAHASAPSSGVQTNPGLSIPGLTGSIAPANRPATQLTSGFTYQGRLTVSGSPANGQFDLQFTLFDSLSGGSQVGSPVTVISQTVTDGLFTVSLDFGSSAFQGSARYLELAVRPGGSGGSFTTLSPRQALTASPYALSIMPGAVITGSVSGFPGSAILSLTNTAPGNTFNAYANGATALAGYNSGNGNG